MLICNGGTFMKKKFLTLIFVLFSAIPVFAADWVQLDTKLYIDNSSITKYKQLHYPDRNTYSVWLKWLNDKTSLWTKLEKISKKKLWYYKQMAIIDCANKEVAIRTTTYYDLAEKPVDKINYEAYYLDWQSIVPESVGETIYHYVCGE